MKSVTGFRFALVIPMVFMLLLALSLPVAANAVELSGSSDALSLRIADGEGLENVEDSYNLENATIEPIDEQIAYRREGPGGSYYFLPVTPSVVVLLDGKELKQGTDYEISYDNNDQPGIATVNVTGIGDYSGVKSATFNVVGDAAYDISKATISGLDDIELYSHDLHEIEYDNSAVWVGGFVVTLAGKELDYCDYDDVAQLDKSAGKVTITVTGKGAYFGEKIVQINAIAHFENLNMRCYNKVEYGDLTYDEDEGYYLEPTAYYLMNNQKYTGKAIQPKVNVEVYGEDENSYSEWYDDYGNVYQDYDEFTIRLKEGRDYKLVYKNNTSIGKATVSVVGIGIYRGTINKTFKITYPISKAKISAISKKTYKGKAIKPKPKVKCLGKTLKLGTDYTLSYKKNRQGGKATVVVKGKGYYTGSVKKTFKIYVSMKRVKVKKIADQCLYSDAAKPKPVVKVGSVKLKLGRDYTLSYKNNRKAGKATVIVKGKGYYKGKKKVTFTIIPKGVGSTITMAEFNKIKLGMSYRKVKYLIGGAGRLTYAYDAGYEDCDYVYDEEADDYYEEWNYVPCYMETYEWTGNKAYSYASIGFENGVVTRLHQYGL